MNLPVAASIVCVVESNGRYLMIKEDRGAPDGPIWYFPSGAIEAGEMLAEAAAREVLEETGCRVEPVSLISIDHGAFLKPSGLLWWRFTVAARLASSEQRRIEESAVIETGWFAIERIDGLNLRNHDAAELCGRAVTGVGLPLDACLLSADGRLAGFFA